MVDFNKGLTPFHYSQYMDQEDFIIGLQSKFIPTDQIKQMLKIVGNVKSEKVLSSADDGVSQSVEGRKGINFAEKIGIPNPVKLKPFRTFIEVPQPESNFIFRARDGRRDGEMPTFALFEADGGFWKIDAMNEIKKYLDLELKDVVSIIK